MFSIAEKVISYIAVVLNMSVLPQGWDKTATPGCFAPLTSDHVPEMQTGFIVRMGEYFLSKIQWNAITTNTNTFWWRLISCVFLTKCIGGH